MTMPPDGEIMNRWRHLSCRLRKATESMEPTLKAAGTHSLADFEAVELLAASPDGELRQRAVQDELGLSQSGTSRLAGRLERAGLVRRSTAAEDGRATTLRITDTGRDMAERHREAFAEQARLALTAITGSPGADANGPDVEASTAGGVLRFGESLLTVDSEAVTVVDAINVRDVLEPLILVEAARFRTDGDVRDCERILAEMAALLDDPARFYRADWSLHRRLAGICRNDLLRLMYLSLLDTLEEHADDVVRTDGLHGYLRRRLVIHTEIIDAVASGRLDRVRAAAKAHAFTSNASSLLEDDGTEDRPAPGGRVRRIVEAS